MNEAEFNQHVDELLMAYEETIDDSGADLDYENNGSVMTITCEANGSQVIVSRQSATKEIWVAAKSGGFHCRQQGDDWVCGTTDETLAVLMARVVREQSGEEVSF